MRSRINLKLAKVLATLNLSIGIRIKELELDVLIQQEMRAFNIYAVQSKQVVDYL